jgi:hypothetical protein
LVAGLKREFGTSPLVPAHVDLTVLAAFEERRSAASGRRNAWRFAAVAAAVALVVWVGSATWPRPKPTTTIALHGYGNGSVGGGIGATLAENRKVGEATAGVTDAGTGGVAIAGSKADGRATLDLKAAGGGDLLAPSTPSSGLPVALATVDADGNGRVNILDAMRMAKTVEAVRYVRELNAKADASGEAGVAIEKEKMAFFVASLDVTWDLTADGVVDEKDADLLAARIVSVGKGGV